MKIRHLAGLAFAAVLAFGGTALAQSSDPEGAPYSKLYHKERPVLVNMSFVREEGVPDGTAILRLAAYSTVTGCPKMSDMPVSVSYLQPFMDIKVGSYTVDMRNLTSAPQYGCDKGYKIPSADVVLSRGELLKNKVSQIRLDAGGRMSIFDIDVDDHHIRLHPAAGTNYFRALKASNVKNTLNYWFYPEGTVILSAPAARDDHRGVEAAIMKLAAQKGLEPLESVWPGFKSPLVVPDGYYYVDKGGAIADGVLGKAQVERARYGLKGDETVPDTLDVVAKAPGLYE